MNYTATYKLPQWAESDRIMMKDFNDAFESIEDGLTQIKTTADGAATAAAQGKQAAAALTPRVTAVEQAVKFVKLGGPVVTTAADQTVTFSMTGIDVSQYTAFFVVIQAASSFGSVNLLVNGSTLTTLCSNNWSESGSVAWVVPGASKILGFSQGCYSSSETTNSYSNKGALTLAWSTVSSIGVSGTSNAGMCCTLYGLKG